MVKYLFLATGEPCDNKRMMPPELEFALFSLMIMMMMMIMKEDFCLWRCRGSKRRRMRQYRVLAAWQHIVLVFTKMGILNCS
jgi:hypothetical protein